MLFCWWKTVLTTAESNVAVNVSFSDVVMLQNGTLPVMAHGVGIGVDYALYILTVVPEHVRAGVPLDEAFYRADLFTAKPDAGMPGGLDAGRQRLYTLYRACF